MNFPPAARSTLSLFDVNSVLDQFAKATVYNDQSNIMGRLLVRQMLRMNDKSVPHTRQPHHGALFASTLAWRIGFAGTLHTLRFEVVCPFDQA